MARDVFISHSSKDKNVADATCTYLELRGIKCWVAPRDIRPGENWGGSIVNAIRNSRIMVLIFSDHANASPQIKREVERAVNAGSTVIPMRIENVLPKDDLEYFLGMPHWLDAFTPPLEGHLEALARAVKEILEMPASPPIQSNTNATTEAAAPAPTSPPVASKQLSLICSNCQTANSPKARFCRTCGQATVTEQASADEVDAPTMMIQPRDATTAPLTNAPSPVSIVARKTVALPSPNLPASVVRDPQIDGARTEIQPPEMKPVARPDLEVRSLTADASPAPSEWRDETAPAFACNFNRIFIEGYNTTFQVSLANLGAAPIEQIVIQLECGAWEKHIERKFARIAPGGRQVLNLDAMPQRAGNFLLNCAIKLVTSGRQLAYMSSPNPTVTVMTKPDAQHMVVNISNSVTGTSSGANAGLGAEIKGGDLNVKDLISKDAIKSINDLLQLEIPDEFVPVDLILDSEMSVTSVEEFKALDKLALTIPREFIGFVQPGTIMKLVPVVEQGATPTMLPVHLIARPVFRIGRRQDQSDMVTWFLPRNPAHDGKTKRISSVHCSMELRGKSFWLLDNNTPNYTTFDTTRVTVDEPIEFNRRGIIGLAGEYFIDALPFACNDPKGPAVSNLRAWSGPQKTAERPISGCVRFAPTNTDLAFHDAVWLPSDGTFGTSRSNPIVLNAPGLAEIQGRFHHWHGCFWLENPIGNHIVRLAGVTLKSNDMVPLVNGIILELGPTKMRVEILA